MIIEIICRDRSEELQKHSKSKLLVYERKLRRTINRVSNLESVQNVNYTYNKITKLVWKSRRMNNSEWHKREMEMEMHGPLME